MADCSDQPDGSDTYGKSLTDTDPDKEPSPESEKVADNDTSDNVRPDTAPGSDTFPADNDNSEDVNDPDTSVNDTPSTVNEPPVNDNDAPDAPHADPDVVTVPNVNDNGPTDTCSPEAAPSKTSQNVGAVTAAPSSGAGRA